MNRQRLVVGILGVLAISCAVWYWSRPPAPKLEDYYKPAVASNFELLLDGKPLPGSIRLGESNVLRLRLKPTTVSPNCIGWWALAAIVPANGYNRGMIDGIRLDQLWPTTPGNPEAHPQTSVIVNINGVQTDLTPPAPAVDDPLLMFVGAVHPSMIVHNKDSKEPLELHIWLYSMTPNAEGGMPISAPGILIHRQPIQLSGP